MEVALAAQIAGAGINAISALRGGAASSQAANYQAAVAERNAQIARQNAESERLRGGQLAYNQDLKTRQTKGAARAAQGASGADVGSGSATDVQAGIASIGRLDALTILHNSELKARGYEVEALNFDSESEFAKMKGKSAREAALWSAAGSIVGGAAGVSDKWMSYKRHGGKMSWE